MSASATIEFQNEQFIIASEGEWFYIYENYKGKIVLIYETTSEQEAVNYVMVNAHK